MDVKEAARLAREYVTELFIDEEIMNIGLEEVVFDRCSNTWKITIGFARPWDGIGGRNPITRDSGPRPRSYKVVCISDEDGRLESLKDRILVDSHLS
jgi:hypothetical protein